MNHWAADVARLARKPATGQYLSVPIAVYGLGRVLLVALAWLMIIGGSETIDRDAPPMVTASIAAVGVLVGVLVHTVVRGSWAQAEDAKRHRPLKSRRD